MFYSINLSFHDSEPRILPQQRELNSTSRESLQKQIVLYGRTEVESQDLHLLRTENSKPNIMLFEKDGASKRIYI